MARGKENRNGVTSEAFKQTGLQNALKLLEYNGVEKIVLINKDGSAVKVIPSSISDQHTIEKIDGIYSDTILLKKGQNVEIKNKVLTVSSTGENSLIDSIIEVVKSQVEQHNKKTGLTFANNCKIILGKKEGMGAYFPKADNADEYAEKVFPEFFKEPKIEQPKAKEMQVTSINEPFQIVVPGANKIIGITGKPKFIENETMLLIEVAPITSPTDQNTHQIFMWYLTPEGTKGNVVNEASNKFEWRMGDSTISEDQILFGSY